MLVDKMIMIEDPNLIDIVYSKYFISNPDIQVRHVIPLQINGV